MKYAVVDIETTGLDARRDELLEVGIVKVEQGEVLETFHIFVKPSGPIPEEITSLTGITDDMVADGMDEESALRQILTFLNGEPLVAHNAKFDVEFLTQRCDQNGLMFPARDPLCTLKLSQILYPTLPGYGLQDLAKHFDIANGQAHRAVDDAIVCSRLLDTMAIKTGDLPFLLLQQLSGLAQHFSPSLTQWFSSFQTEVGLSQGDTIPNHCEVKDGLIYTAKSVQVDGVSSSYEETGTDGKPVEADEEPSIAKLALDVLGEHGLLSKTLPQYEARGGQLAMAEAVGNAFEQGWHGVIEAGTGTGKSMAYLIPAAFYAKSEQGRVVISTHTLALQDQIEQRDFPTLQRLFSGNLRLAVQKGRKNYVCLRKVRAESIGGESRQALDYQMVMAMLVWLVDTKDGMRDELSTKSVSHHFWTRVQSETDSCINKRCPFFRPCYYFRAKANAQHADIVVTNHSLLLSDLKADHRVLPPYDTVVIDEAHHLAEQATTHLGGEVNSAQIQALSLRLSRDKGKGGILAELVNRYGESQSMPSGLEEKIAKAQEWIEVIRTSADNAFACLAALVPSSQAELRLTDKVIADAKFAQFGEIIEEFREPSAFLRSLVQSLTEWSKRASNDEEAGRVVDAAGFLDNWLQGIVLLEEMTIPSEDKVTWIERRQGTRPRVSVHTAPIDVSETLANALFEPLHSAVLTSATLSVRGAFDFTLNQVGLSRFKDEGRLLTANVESSFDYTQQARLCVPNDVPELAKMNPAEAAMWLADSLYQLALVSHGRLLALFTSHQMLRETAKVLRQPLREAGLALFAQDVDGSRTAMLEAFRNRPESVLLGAQSFWEGIDLPGDQLTTLVIVRLPFAPPSHPVTEARHEKLSREGKSPFLVSSLPEAVVRFRQGFGRLIRTATDRGVVVVYDKRIVTQRYGQTFIQSLSGVRPYVGTEVDVLQHIRTFLG